MNTKLLSIITSVALLFGSFGMVFGTDVVTTSGASDFSDMPDNWSTAALNKAVDNGLLSGYAEGDKKLIKASNSLTRAEMAAVVNRAFASEKMSDLSKVSDVSTSAWYADDMAKAVKMGTFAYDTKMRPGDRITRQEAFTVLARAFKLVGTDANHKALDIYSDKNEIASWALDSLNGLVRAGYIQGSGGKLNPLANISRAEFAVVMDNLIKEYLDTEGDVTEVVAAGNIMVRKAGVVLKNLTIKGDLLVADGVGEGDITLDNVTVKGRTLIRGGGDQPIIVKGDTELAKVFVADVAGEVSIFTEDGTEIEVIYIDDEDDEEVVDDEGDEAVVDGEDDDAVLEGFTPEVSMLAQSHYATGDTLEFTISGLKANTKAKVGMPIYLGVGGWPWASSEAILDNMQEEERNGETVRFWVGTTDGDGVLTVSGKVQGDLPSGVLFITIPTYGIYIDSSIRLQDDQGEGVRVGDI